MAHKPTPRTLAWELSRLVFSEGAYANLAWENLLGDTTLSTDEKAYATHLAYGTLRHTGTLDAIIEKAASRTAATVDQEVWWVLRLGVFQWLWMRTPAHAVVNESVKLAKTLGLHKTTGLVNAVLRKVTVADLDTWLDQVTEDAPDELHALSLRHAHPSWQVEEFQAALEECESGGAGEDIALLLEANNAPTTPTLVMLPGVATLRPGDTPTPYSPYGVRAEAGSPGADKRVRQGHARVQDEGSQLAALVVTEAKPLGPQEKILDMCSGPGGKSALLQARLTGTGASLTAMEKAPHRAGLVRSALAPFTHSTPAPAVITGDASELLKNNGEVYDRVLLDAPCTGLGALRRRPESRWRKNRSDLDGLVNLQRQLLDSAWQHTAPGGLIVYVTCSPVSAETTGHMTWLQENYAVTLLDTPAILEKIVTTPLTGHRRGQAVQLWPHRHNTDAMFIQAIQREG